MKNSKIVFLKIDEIAEVVDKDGLTYAIQHGIGSNEIEDKTLAIMWEKTQLLIEKIDEYIKKRRSIENDLPW